MSNRDEQWVVFWCSLLAPILLEQVPDGKRRRFLDELSRKEVLLPNGQRKRISLSTLRRKVVRFRERKIAGLRKQPRCDRGCARKDRQAMIARAIELKKEQPRRSDIEINQLLREEFQATIPKSTLYRHLTRAGATRQQLPYTKKRPDARLGPSSRENERYSNSGETPATEDFGKGPSLFLTAAIQPSKRFVQKLNGPERLYSGGSGRLTSAALTGSSERVGIGPSQARSFSS